jgi:aspartyl-tRNA(Asn)/glutamyl-tRNA(Gln) amidotransferase subunit C
MTVDNDILLKLEKLSSLKVDNEHREETIKQLNEIVSFVDNLNELNTDDLGISFNPSGKETFLREDIPFKQEEVAISILKNAPLSEDNFFIVPAIIE